MNGQRLPVLNRTKLETEFWRSKQAGGKKNYQRIGQLIKQKWVFLALWTKFPSKKFNMVKLFEGWVFEKLIAMNASLWHRKVSKLTGNEHTYWTNYWCMYFWERENQVAKKSSLVKQGPFKWKFEQNKETEELRWIGVDWVHECWTFLVWHTLPESQIVWRRKHIHQKS